MNFNRILTIAKNVFWEVIRDRVLYLIGFFALILVAAKLLLPELAILGTDQKILMDLGLAAMGILGLIVAIFVGTGLINQEIEKRTVLSLIAKPVSRTELIVGKHIGLSLVLAILVLFMTLTYLVVLTFAGIPYPLGTILVSALYLFFELSLLTAVALLFGVFTSSLLATLFTFGVYLMGHFSRDLLKAGELSKNPGLERITEGIYLVLPDLSRLDLKNLAVYGILPSFADLMVNAVYGLVYTVLLLAIASLIFSQREF